MDPIKRALRASLTDPEIARILSRMGDALEKQRRILDGLLRVVARLEKRVDALEAIRKPPTARTGQQRPRALQKPPQA